MKNSIPLRMKETTTITKFAPGVDPRDPNSVPIEVIQRERYLTEEELKKLFSQMEEQLDEQNEETRSD